MNMEVKSTAFQEGAMIPKLYTCDDKDISPPLSWSGLPAGAKSIALIMDDPDAPVGTWVHWVIFKILRQRLLVPAIERFKHFIDSKGNPTIVT